MKRNLIFAFISLSLMVLGQSKSKSARTAPVTVVKISKHKLETASKLHDIIPQIPDSCTVNHSLFKMYCKRGIIELEMSRPLLDFHIKALSNDCKMILVENIESSCAKVHNANYKIIVQ